MLRDMWREAEHKTESVRLLGDLAVAGFFEGTSARERNRARDRYASAVSDGDTDSYRDWLLVRRNAEPPLVPFHWEIEFPEVFARENPGFDAIVGNPPFAGKNSVAAGNVARYPDWLKEVHEASHGNADLVAHFFRRGFNLLRDRGSFGLIATNTIAQGDTRSTGLRWICLDGGEIYHARTRYQWPGMAAVVVSVVHVFKGEFQGSKSLDGRLVETISAFLFHGGGDNDPVQLRVNARQSFIGSYLLGMGFTFDDTDTKGVATPIAQMDRLLADNPSNQRVILPYIGGEEINAHPAYPQHRFVINFGNYPLRREECIVTWDDSTDELRQHYLRSGVVPLDYPDPVASDWPDLIAIVESKVKPDRLVQNRTALRDRWWQYAEKRPGLYSAIHGLARNLTVSRVGQHAAFAFLPIEMVFAESLVVFPFESHAAFCALQAQPHEIWARFFGSSMKDDLRYTPSDCFETFPFPIGWESHAGLEEVGKAYYAYRAALMVRNNEGLTKTYNRFHDPYEDDPEIVKLRDLHTAMDRAVLDAYGWTDVSTDCDFLLDYEIDEAEWGKRKKPYRYRWPNEVRDDILARLLELNAQRAAEEARAGKGKSPSKRKTNKKRTDSSRLAGTTLL